MGPDVLLFGSEFTKAKRTARSLNAFGMRAKEDDRERTNSTTRSNPTHHGVARFRGRAAAEDCGARQSGTGGGGSVPGISRGAELARASGGESAVPGADGRGEDARCGSDGRSAVWRPARRDDSGLRRVSALA